MKKIFYIVCCCLLSAPVAADYWKMGYHDECIVHANASGTHDVFYYCGDQKGVKSCAGNPDSSYDTSYSQKVGVGEKVSTGDSYGTLWCCENKDEDAEYEGKYVRATENYIDSFKYEEPVTIKVDGGTCTYKKITNACGELVEDNPCTEATDCTKGYIKRNDVCVKPCPNGYVFESKDSNECISCETTAYSGIHKDYCLTCDKDTSFYDKTIKNCISKKTMSKYSSEQMAKCFMCKSDETFKKCLKGESTSEKDCPIE